MIVQHLRTPLPEKVAHAVTLYINTVLEKKLKASGKKPQLNLMHAWLLHYPFEGFATFSTVAMRCSGKACMGLTGGSCNSLVLGASNSHTHTHTKKMHVFSLVNFMLLPRPLKCKHLLHGENMVS